ncbi:MAG TPA: homoserine kinase [Acidimicrobiia bacterium]|nr:homoserine kinase [Acidimicrobiia bacterium]
MITVSAPASSANLGPGFDVLALALEIRCQVTVSESGDWALRSNGGPADEAAMALVRSAAEEAAPGSGPYAVDIVSDIPIARGLGSSAALIVAVAGAVRAATGGSIDTEEVCLVAAAVEGHPDNVAAAAFGGAVMVSPSGLVRQIAMHPSLHPVVAVPHAHLSTRAAREALAAEVPLAVAARTAARIAFLLEGLRTGDAAVLAEAAGDELHEARRAALSPVTGSLMTAARDAGAVHTAWSGAGPSVLALVTDDRRDAVRSALTETLGNAGEIVEPEIAHTGFQVEAS